MSVNPRYLSTLDNKKESNPVNVKHGLEIFAGSDVRASWDDYIGQDKAKAQVELAIASADKRGARLGHVLLASGIAGLGKTHLAKLIAYHMGVGLVEASGPMTAEDARKLIRGMEDHDVLFIDECHALGRKADWLLRVMTDHVLLTAEGEEVLPDITIIGATTDPGKLTEALLSRFTIKPQLTFYDDDQSHEIVLNLASRMKVNVEEEWVSRIAQAANYTPRGMRTLLSVILDMQTCEQEVDLDIVFSYSGVTADGLDAISQGILVALLGQPRHTASGDSLAAILGETDAKSLIYAERDLISKGLLTRAPRGRTLSESGAKRAKELLG